MKTSRGDLIGVCYNEKTDYGRRLKNCLSLHIDTTMFLTCATNLSYCSCFFVVSFMADDK